ncbi:MAG TPA: 2OG-Fe(II) oxygenase [Mycobacteriales bacterium]|nr:2OG-Fe(II) oxygenase [Mycobacteriales bacterium]
MKSTVESQDWTALADEMDRYGCALTDELIPQRKCAELIDLYEQDARFRSTIDMERYRFGRGEYRYFDYPLPKIVDDLRHEFYPRLLPIAQEWAGRLGRDAPWPDTLDEWLEQCHAAGQEKPTAILLKYGEGDWNALHRDLYGELVFPLQVVIGLNDPESDFTGGEFMMLEQRPRAQSRGIARTLPRGHGLIFTTRERPVKSTRGWAQGPMRHGVNEVRSGIRHTLGLVFHNAA